MFRCILAVLLLPFWPFLPFLWAATGPLRAEWWADEADRVGHEERWEAMAALYPGPFREAWPTGKVMYFNGDEWVLVPTQHQPFQE